jgi:UDP-N-acetylmuramoylalanine--D-glutamate ligase
MIFVGKKEMTFKDKNIVVVGLARSGTGAANLLSALGANVTITDSKSRTALEAYMKKLLPSVHVLTDGNPPEIFDDADMVVISPGVPAASPSLERARRRGIPVIGELELAYQVITYPLPLTSYPSFIGITGTNGKSTTTTLADLILKEAGFRTLLGGNIGIALTEELYKAVSDQRSVISRGERPFPPASIDYVVTEISSFQLETIHEFRPKIAAILNITPDHLDRYKNMQEYIDAKVRIFENQTRDDFLILNADDPILMELYNAGFNSHIPPLEKGGEGGFGFPKVLFFSRKKEVEGAYFRDGVIYFNLPESITGTYGAPLQLSVNEIRIQGVHNIENAMASSLIALVSGCPPKAVRKVLRDFPGLEHRLEFAGEVRGVRFINDSKGTNIGAVLKSLEGFDRVVLIMGGLDKGSDFSVLQDLVRRKVKALILIGKAKDKIAKALGSVTETFFAGDLQAAVDLSLSKASPGDIVLLSPGCASFDMFRDFEDRGRKFKEAVREISR